MNNIEREIESLHTRRLALEAALKEKRKRMKFLCGCGHMHAIRDCTLIQTHWYTAPHGCIGGDYWNTGEMQIVCPYTDAKNRLMFDSKYKVDYDSRNRMAYSAEDQFRRIYTDLFKEVIQDYDKDNRRWWLNKYFDENRKRFGLKVEGLDK